MKRHIPGLSNQVKGTDDLLEGIFLVRIDRANYRWHPQRPFFLFRFAILEPFELRSHSLSGRMYCTPKALWRLNWLLRDFGYDPDLLGREEVDERALVGLQGIIRTSAKTLAGRSFLNLDGFAPAAEWDSLANQGLRIRQEKTSHDLQLHTD
jgi:hypothetical protein